jgi:hypothetical protein
MNWRSERGHVPAGLLILIAILLLVVLLLWWLCYHPSRVRATPAPTFTTPIDSTPRDTVLAYARSLGYDTATGAGDMQRLMVGTVCPPWAGGGNCTYGPLARIEPESGSYAISDTVALGSGRIIARIVTFDSAYAKLSLSANDTTYWWIEKAGATWRSIFISSDTLIPLATADTTQYYAPATHQWHQSLARFIWSDSDEQLWSTCTEKGCCRALP